MFSIIREEGDWQRIYECVPAPKTHLHYQYVSAAANLEQDGYAELAIWQDDETLIAHPYIRRVIPQATGFYDLRSAFEFGGFWLGAQSKLLTTRTFNNFNRAFEQYCTANRIVCEFIRFHPYLPYVPETGISYELSKQAQNITIALNQPYDQIFAGYHPSKRKQVRQGRRHGLHISTSDDYDSFVKMYHTNLDRLNADKFYYFPASFFQAVREFLELKLIHNANGELCAAHCYLRDGDIFHAFLCHARQEKLSLRPNDYAYDSVISSLENSAYRHFHFGGGAPSLSAYKKQFSPNTVPYVTGQKIFLPDEYQTLTNEREVQLDGPCKSAGYFPAYRAR